MMIKKSRLIKILLCLMILSIVISYAHRFLVADRQLDSGAMVIKDTVIPAIEIKGTKAGKM